MERFNRARWGNPRRFELFSRYYGFDRRTPVDRVYIERFLPSTPRTFAAGPGSGSSALRPRVPGLVSRRRRDRGHRREQRGRDDRRRPSEPNSLPANRFDCFILTQTLQLVSDLEAPLENAWQSLTSGGVLLITLPGITRADPEHTGGDRWRGRVT